MVQADRTCEKRLTELALRADKTGVAQLTGFLSPAEQAQAVICAKKAGVPLFLSGEDGASERRIAAFAADDWTPEWQAEWLTVRWSARAGSVTHRDVLGSVLALGIDRVNIGDIHVSEDAAQIYARKPIAAYIAANLTRVGGVSVMVDVAEESTAFKGEQPSEVRASLASPRLDAILGAVWRLSRGRAAELVLSGRVQVDHRLELKPDRQLMVGATISTRGLGRVRVLEIGAKTRKGRTFVTLARS